MLHQKHVPRLQKIRHALDGIGNLSPQKEDQLVEFMVVIVEFLRAAVLEMEQSKILVEISPLTDLTSVQQIGPPPFSLSYRSSK